MLRSAAFGLCCLAWLCPCLAAQEEAPAVIPAALEARLARLLPEPAEVQAARAGEAKFFSTDLYKYIDGGADIYLDYGLLAMVHQRYRASSADVTVDVYDLGTESNAFGIYAAESSPDYHFLPIGSEGYGTNEVLNFFQAEFYVKLSAFSEQEKTGPVLERFAREVSRRIGPASPMPGFLSLFPPPDLLGHSAKFVRKSPLGLDFLGPAILAAYAWGGKEATLLLSKAPDAKGAAQRVSQLREYFGRTGKVTAQPELAAGAFLGLNSSEGEAVFFASGSYVILLLNPPPNPQPFLKSVAERIAEKGDRVLF
jgi:hypothetical protein